MNNKNTKGEERFLKFVMWVGGLAILAALIYAFVYGDWSGMNNTYLG